MLTALDYTDRLPSHPIRLVYVVLTNVMVWHCYQKLEGAAELRIHFQHLHPHRNPDTAQEKYNIL